MRFYYTLITLILFVPVNSTDSAMVETAHGTPEGRVIVRQFDEQTVITIITKDNRIYQFYSNDVKLITSEDERLLRRNVKLRSEPAEDSVLVIEEELERGFEIIPLDTPEDNGWIKIKAWGEHEGWIPKDVLTDEVEFMAEPILPRTDLFQQANQINAASHVVKDATAQKSIEAIPDKIKNATDVDSTDQ